MRCTRYLETKELTIPEETQKILSYAADFTGKDFMLIPDPKLETWGTVKAARRAMPNHMVRYNPRYGDKLGYLLAHEAGHIIRMWSVAEEDRKIPGTTESTLEEWSRELYVAAPAEIRKRLPYHVAGRMITIWQTGLLVQVTNTPADMRIERWLWEQHPTLADYQRVALLGQVEENYKVLDKRIREMTPRSVYEPNNTMNSAFAHYLSRFLDSEIAERYRPTSFYHKGNQLAEEVWGSPDRGHLSDMAGTEKWARLFGLDKILEWRDFEDVPEGYFR